MPVSLSAWETFYVITGSSGAALTGLMFVVVALAADRAPSGTSADGFGAFSTPTVTHFASALLVAAVMTIPLHTALSLTVCLAGCALAGLVATGLAGVRMRRARGYTPGADDWSWFVVLPFTAYGVLLAAALLMGRSEATALVMVAGVVMALLAIGIRNAWDVAVYLVAMGVPATSGEDQTPAPAAGTPVAPPSLSAVPATGAAAPSVVDTPPLEQG